MVITLADKHREEMFYSNHLSGQTQGGDVLLLSPQQLNTGRKCSMVISLLAKHREEMFYGDHLSSHYSGVRRIYFSRGRNTFEGGQTRARRARKNFLPPLFSFLPPRQNSILPPGQDWQEGGQKTLLYLEKEGETFNNRSLSKPQLTVQFFLMLCFFCTQKLVL